MVCLHGSVQHGLCYHCGSAVDTRRQVFIPFNYIGDGIEVRPEFVGKIKHNVWIKSLKEKRLTLVLGLHGTLYDRRRVSHLSDGEKYLIGEVKSRSDMWLSNKVFPDGGDTLCKLRPFVHEFLREANKLFKLHVYELWNPEHVEEVVSFLDPHGTYFKRRVITNRDCEMKNLDLVLADERGIVILDDRHVHWWPGDRTNLLEILPYRYFKRSNNETWIIQLVDLFKKTFYKKSESKSWADDRGDEEVEYGGLAIALSLLKEMHSRFFSEEDKYLKDVRILLSP